MINELTDANFEEKVSQADTLVLVDFWAAWCGPCRMLGAILKELSDEDDIQALFYKVNVDENPVIAEKFKINSLPTVIVFDKGEVKNILVGVRPKMMYKEILI